MCAFVNNDTQRCTNVLKYKMFEVETSKAQNPVDCGIGYD